MWSLSLSLSLSQIDTHLASYQEHHHGSEVYIFHLLLMDNHVVDHAVSKSHKFRVALIIVIGCIAGSTIQVSVMVKLPPLIGSSTNKHCNNSLLIEMLM